MQIPLWAEALISKPQAESISEHIRQAETHTTGEIVVVLVPRSSWQPHIWLIASGLIAITLITTVHSLVLFSGLIAGERESTVIVASTIASCLLGFFCTRFAPLQRIFYDRREMERQVAMRAELEFHRAGISGTRAQTGILIFVSFFEHRVVVLADKAINTKIDRNTAWEELVTLIIRGVRDAKLHEGLNAAITKAGELLASHFPAQRENPNELADHLIIRDD